VLSLAVLSVSPRTFRLVEFPILFHSSGKVTFYTAWYYV